MTDLSSICDLHHSSPQRQIVNPLSKARDRTCVLMDASQIHFHWAMTGTSSHWFLKVHWTITWHFFFLVFLGPHPQHLEVPRLGVESELQLPTACGNIRSSTHWARPGMEPASSRILVRFVSTEPQWELLPVFFKNGTWHRAQSLDIADAERLLNADLQT